MTAAFAALRAAPLAVFVAVAATGVMVALSATAFQVDPTLGFVSSQPVAVSSASGGSTVRVGGPVPDFVLDDLDGSPRRFSDLVASGPGWITFWATWCGPCRAEAPDTEAVLRKYRSRGLTYVAIDVGEGQDVVRDFLSQYSWDSLMDPSRTVSARFGVRMLPTHVFVGADGVVGEIRPGILNRGQMESRVEDLIASWTR